MSRLVVLLLCLMAQGFPQTVHPALTGAVASADPPLRHRAFLGMGFRSATAAERDSLGLPAGALIINRVLPDGAAEAAGMRPGDVIQSAAGKAVAEEAGLRAILHGLYAGDEIPVTVLRDGVHHDLRLIGGAAPEEQADSIRTEYTSFLSRGVRLRAVITSPPDSEGKRLPGLLIVSALRSPQLIGSSFYSLSRALAHGAARAGFRVLRFELRGFGDSEGEDYHTTDFEAEVADNVAAFDYLAARSDVDAGRVLVYGHSTGGMEAAVLASGGKAAGLITSCTIGRTFLERTADTIRLQAALAGEPPEQVDASVNRYLSFCAAILHGAPAERLRSDSTFAGFFNQSGRIMDDRTIDFWRQQLGLSLGGTYSRVRCPTLIVYGASDFLTSLACHERIRDVLASSGNRDVTLAVIPACDHAYSWAKDREEAFRNQQTGDFKENPAAIGRIVDWLRDHATGS